MKRITLIISLILMIFTFGCNPKKEKSLKGDSSNNNGAVITNEGINENTVKVIDTVTETVVIKDTVIEKVIVKEPVMVENEDGSTKKVSEAELKKASKKNKKFYVIAGSFKNINNAVKLRKYYKSKGYSALILYPYHGYNRVATGTYVSRASAEKDIKIFRAKKISYKGEKVDYWLLWR